MEKAGVDRAWSYRVVYPVVAKTGRIIRDGSQLLAYSIIFSYFTFIPSVHADPTGGNITGGIGDINQAGLNTTINQASQNMVIDWQSYNVNVDERVQYIQPSPASISLNRILSNTGSTIAGHIDANGHVILVNPNGVFFTPTAQINVGGIIASGLNISPSDFMNGDYIFNEVLGAEGAVINSGTINASMGGNVALIGRSVENNGFISANLGSVTLAAGKQAVLTFDNNGLLGVRISQEILQNELGVDVAVLNSGDINAAGGRVLLTGSVSKDVFSQAVNSGEQAHSVVVNADGTFSLGAGADVVNSGNISVSSTDAAGQIVLLGENVSSSGEMYADVTNGHGGEIELHASDTTLLTENSVTSAIAETSGQGGIVKVLGDKVGLFDQSMLDVSGANGGGQALIGGDYQGKNHYIKNATATVVGNATKINADAKVNGDGGKVILWSDKNTYFYGNIFTRGGLFSGNGGFVEVSGKQNLLFDGIADRTAGNGLDGLLLLDPDDLTIVTGDSNSGTQDNTELSSVDLNVFFTDGSGGGFNITASRLVSVLSSGNVLLQARRDILVNTAITTSSTNTNNLIFQAGDDITLNGGINIGAGDISLTAGVSSCNGSCLSSTSPHDLTINAGLNTTGSIFLNAADSISINQTIGGTRTPSSLIVRAGDSIVIDNTSGGANGSITTNGAVSLTASDASLVTDVITVSPNGAITGSISLEGDVATNGGNFTAITTSGYFDNWFDNQNLNVGAGNIIITTNGNATFNVGGSNVTAGAFLGDITTTGSGYLSITTTAGQIIQSTNSAQNLDITGTSAFNAGAHAITLQNTTNDLQGAITLTTTGNNSVVLNNAATTTNFGVVSVGGGLTFNTGLNFGFTNAFNVTGAALLNFGQDNTGRTFTMSSGLSISAGSLSVNGGTGNDIFNIGSSMPGQMNGGDGNDVFNITNAGLNITALNGNNGDDSLTAANESNYWNVDAAGSSAIYASAADRTATTLTRVSFTGIEAVTGGSGIDDFIVLNPTGLSGLLDGGGASDVLALGTDGVTVQLGNRTLANAVADTNLNVSGVETIIANSAAAVDTLIADNLANTWAIGASTSVAGVSFSNFNVLTGGTGVDTFNISANFSGTLNGGNSNDIFNIAANVTGNINGGDNNDIFNINANGLTNTIVGGNDADTLNAFDTTNAWVINGANAGTLNTASIVFSETESLVGALTQNDIFSFSVTPTVAAVAVDGRGHVAAGNVYGDEVDLSMLNGQVVSVQLGATGYSNIEQITGNNTDSTLIGDSNNNIWNITGNNSGDVAGLYFSEFNNLTGGTGIDTFNIAANVTGNIRGGDNVDIFNMGNTPFTGVLEGGAGSDTLNAFDTVANWSITALHTGQLNNVDFIGMENLVGAATSNDTFTFNVTPAVAAVTIDGLGHTSGDEASFSGVVGAVSFQLGAAGFSNIERFTGNDTNSALTGENNTNTWTVTGAHAGTVDGVNFSGFTALVGGNNNDTFNFNVTPTTAAVTVVGSGQTDTLSFAGLAGQAVSVQLGATGFSNIEQITGNGTNSILTGENNANTWAVTGAQAGTVDGVGFSGFTALVGGTNNDIFNFNVTPATAALTVNGSSQATSDTVSFAGLTGQAVSVLLGATGFSNIEQFTGNNTNSTLVGAADTTNTWTLTGQNDGTVNSSIVFTDFNNLLGGNATDNFIFNTGSSLTGMLDGGGGAVDSVNMAALGTVSVVLGTTVNNVEQITGNNTNSTLTGSNVDSAWSITAANDGSVNGIIFYDFNNLTGGGATDIFAYTGNGGISGLVNGGAGSDSVNMSTLGAVNIILGQTHTNVESITGNNSDANNSLTGENIGSTWNITGINDGAVNGITFTNINNLVGGTGADIFTITSTGQVNSIDMGAGVDSFTISGGAVGIVNGNTGNDTFTRFDGSTVGGFIGGLDTDFIVDTSANVVVRVGTNLNGFEGVTAGNGLGTIYAQDAANIDSTWTINAENAGSILDTDGEDLAFVGFVTLNGGSGIDEFNVTDSGSVTGVIYGYGGDDSLNVELSAAQSGSVNFIGGDGTDAVNISNAAGNSTQYLAETYTPAQGVYDEIIAGNNFNTRYDASAEDITTSVNSATLVINGSGADELIQLGAGVFTVGAFRPVSYSNVANIMVNGQAGADTVNLNTFSIGGALTLTAETVTGNTTLTANSLILNNVNQFGSDTTLINTNINTLQLINAGPVYIDEVNGLNIITTSTVTNTGIFNIVGTTNINAGNGSLTLNNALNDFDTVNVSNANAISLADMDSINGGTIIANSVTLRTVEGIGSDQNLVNVGTDVNHLQTRTANLAITNTTRGGVYIDNNQSATVAITNNGYIEFTNTSGNVIIDRIYTNNGAYPAPVPVDSYIGNAIVNINNGSLTASTANNRTGLLTPDIVAEDLTVYVTNGFGSPARYMSLRVNDTFTFVGITGYVHYFGGDPRTTIGVEDLFDFSSFASGLFNQQLVEVESLADVDPAIFTAVRNYNYDDISIRMPSDQLYEDDEEEER